MSNIVILLIISIVISIALFIKDRNSYSIVIFSFLIASILLMFVFNLPNLAVLLYWLSLLLVLLYSFIKKENRKKVLILLYIIPFIVDAIDTILKSV